MSLGQLAAMILRAGAPMAALQLQTSTSNAFGNLFFKIQSKFFSVLAFSFILFPRFAWVHRLGSRATLHQTLQVLIATGRNGTQPSLKQTKEKIRLRTLSGSPPSVSSSPHFGSFG